MMKLRRNQKGFTLIEVLLIVVILGIIAAIAIPRLMASKAQAEMESCKSNLANLNTAIEKFYFDTGDWPDDLADLDTADYMPDGIPTCPSGGGGDAAYEINANNRAECEADGHTITF